MVTNLGYPCKASLCSILCPSNGTRSQKEESHGLITGKVGQRLLLLQPAQESDVDILLLAFQVPSSSQYPAVAS